MNKTPDYSIVPTAILNDKRITPRALKVYIAIKSFMNKETHECFPSRQIISKMTDIPPARISVETDRLEKTGWIKKTGSGGRSTPCVYTMLTPKPTQETVTELITVMPQETVTKSVTVTDSETVTNLDKTVTNLSVNGYQFDTKTVTNLVTGKEQTNEQTKNRPEEQTTTDSAPSPSVAEPIKPLRAKPKNAMRPLPDDFVLTDSLMEWAKKNGHTHMQERYDYFIEQAKIKGYQYADWNLAFQKSVRDNWAKINITPFNSIQTFNAGANYGYQKLSPANLERKKIADYERKLREECAALETCRIEKDITGFGNRVA